LAVGLALAALTPVASSLAAGAAAKPAAGATRSAVLKAFAAADGNASEVKGIYVSRSNAALAVVCEKTPEAGYRAYVFAGAHGSWRLSALGVPGRAGNSSDRQVERACP
jgi:phosphoglucomutase